jgi:phospholipid transport system substrate-binding protein
MLPCPRPFAVVAALALSLAVVSDLWAGPVTDQLRGQIDRVIKVLDDPRLKGDGHAGERRVAMRKIVDESFDFGEMAKRSLGPHWAGRTAAERDEFVHLFSDLLERTYLSRITQYNGEPIVYTGESVDGEQAVVRTKIVTRQGTEIPVDYHLLRRSERWLVYDVRIESISLVGNYRTQFNKIIQTTSYRELVRKLQAKRDESNALVKQSR